MSRPRSDSEPDAASRARPAMPGIRPLAVAAVALVALVLSPVTYVLVLLAACVAATGELFRAGRHLDATPVPLAGFAAVAALFALAYRGPDALLSGFPSVAGGTAAVALIVLVLRSRIAGALAGAASTVAAPLTVGGFGAFAVVLRRAPGGFRVTVAFIAMVAANEIAARIADAYAPRRPLAATIAPDPSWTGVVAGTAATAIAATIAGATLGVPVTTPRALVLSLVVALAVPLGRVCVAMVRGRGAAGGVLARIGGALFAAPMVYFAYRAMVR